MLDYIRDGDEIYRRSFSIIRAEADLSRHSRRSRKARGARRACQRHGRRDPRPRLFAEGRHRRPRSARRRRADPVRLPHGGGGHHPRAPAERTTTSSARWPIRRCRSWPQARQRRARPRRWNCGGRTWPAASSPIGNAPTVLFRLLEMLDEGAPKPALILGFPGRLRRRRGIEGGARRRTAAACPSSSSAAGAAAARWPRRRSTRWRRSSSNGQAGTAVRPGRRPGRSRADHRQGAAPAAARRRWSPISPAKGKKSNALQHHRSASAAGADHCCRWSIR